MVDDGVDVALAIRGGPDLGEAVMAEGALAPITAARRIVRKDEARGEVAIERQPVEVRRRERAEVLHPVSREEAGTEQAIAEHDVVELTQWSTRCHFERTDEREERVLTLEHARGVERTERASETLAREADEHLRDARTTAREVRVGQRA